MHAILITSLVPLVGYCSFFLFSPGTRFMLRSAQGALLQILLVCLGLVVTWQKDIRHNREWYGNFYQQGDLLMVRIDEPLIAKPKSFKANGVVEAVIHNHTILPCKGKILVYFSRNNNGDSTRHSLQYGDKVLIHKNIQRINNSGNPGAFNYPRYAAFQQVFHQVFLKEKDWKKTHYSARNAFYTFLFKARDEILQVLRKSIGGKDELGIAEALLIGYTLDLDKDLVQAYSNTGVVHIIAISGMHLALIYFLLVQVFKKIPILNRSGLLQVVLILTCLWIFALLTGASASVLRAAVMFSFITIGANFKKRSSIYNSLAAAAFLMLCYNPYFLWDVGFQLSYLAVISIIVFQQPVYNWWYIKNKWAEKIWKLAAVSLSAQILTFPVCIYYFHQFPNFFLFTNIIAIPLSGIILYTEIGLIGFSWIPIAHTLGGKLVAWLISLMNQTVLWVNKLPFSVSDGIPSTVLSTCLLYGVVIGVGAWLMSKSRSMLYWALTCLLAFVLTGAYENWQIENQQRIVVYNIQQHQAIDIIYGTHFHFIGDSVLLQDAGVQNFILRPARIASQLNKHDRKLKNFFQQSLFYQFNNTRFLLIDRPTSFEIPKQKIAVDLIIISKNPAVSIAQLANVFDCRQFIFDASNSLWKIEKWQKDCEELHLRSYSVPVKGAFVWDIKK
ncbi:MAG: ComEC/Rec2 family competence protein [Ferruginibacter sp.]